MLGTQTVRTRLREVGMHPRVPAKALSLTTGHNFALYTVYLRSPYARVQTTYLPINILPQVNFGGGSIMFWNGISYTEHTELVALPGARLTAGRYITDLLDHMSCPMEST